MTTAPHLRCPACGGRISPEIEWRGPAYLQEQVCVGFGCDDCLTQWNRDGGTHD